MKVKFDFKSFNHFESRVFSKKCLDITTGSGYWHQKSTTFHILLQLLSSKKYLYEPTVTLCGFCGFCI